MRLLPAVLEKSGTWFNASVICLVLGFTSRITIDSMPLVVLLFGKSWGFVAFNVLGCFIVGVLCGVKEEIARRRAEE